MESTTPVNYDEEASHLLIPSSNVSRSMENSHNISLSDISANEEDLPSRELARCELTAQRDGAGPSSFCLEIVIPELRDEDDHQLDKEFQGLAHQHQPDLDNLFDVRPTMSTAEWLATMHSYCRMPDGLEFKVPEKDECPWSPPLESSSRFYLHVRVLLHSVQPLVPAAKALCSLLCSAWNSGRSTHACRILSDG